MLSCKHLSVRLVITYAGDADSTTFIHNCKEVVNHTLCNLSPFSKYACCRLGKTSWLRKNCTEQKEVSRAFPRLALLGSSHTNGLAIPYTGYLYICVKVHKYGFIIYGCQI
ncbi:hypothetical protein TNCV_2117841 [Trichonephila clavipes]|nr:hypothetical protein TNCV_2117841 [Trichonephila clavipes]